MAALSKLVFRLGISRIALRYEKRSMVTKNSACGFRGGSSILGTTIVVGIVSICKCRTNDENSDTSNTSTNRTMNQDLNQTRKVGAPDNEIRLIVIGKTGCGKSSTGNTILNWEGFQWNYNPTSETTECQWRTCDRIGRKIDVVDTPGIFDNKDTTNETNQKEISRAIALTTPGPHAILFCVSMQRFSHEDVATLQHFLKYFGDGLKKNLIFVFTHYDIWSNEYKRKEKRNPNLDEFIKSLPDKYREILHDCNHRYVVFDNQATPGSISNLNQVGSLIKQIDKCLEDNGGSVYTNEMYQSVEKILKEMEEKMCKSSKGQLPALSGDNIDATDVEESFNIAIHYGAKTVRDFIKTSKPFFDKVYELYKSLFGRE